MNAKQVSRDAESAERSAGGDPLIATGFAEVRWIAKVVATAALRSADSASRLTLLLVLICSWFLVPSLRASDINVVYFAPHTPGVLQFKISLDGQPVELAWNRAIDTLFTNLDRDGNGVLNEKERSILAPQSVGRRRTEPQVATLDSDLAGRLKFEKDTDKAAFAEAMKTAGFGPVNIRIVTGRADSAPLTNALFKQLDADGDGKLSREELSAARSRLAFLDVNEDEWLTTQELLARGVVAVPRRTQTETTEVETKDLLVLTSTGEPAVKQLLAARGKPKATTLSREQMGMSAAVFAKHDRDGNGQLDAEELLGWLQQPPLLNATIELFSDARKPTAMPLGVTMKLNTRFDIAPPTSNSLAEWTANEAQLRGAFKIAAKEGVIDKSTLKDNPQLAAAFGFLDRNADGKLDEKELNAAFDAVRGLANCRADVTIVDQGRGLFEILDANGDGQLSQRELANLPKVVKEFLASDGHLSKSDVPRLFPVQPSLAGIRLLTAPVTREVVDFVGGMAAITPAVKRAGPVWFPKMDRNGDGDVSFKEFLGPLELFQKFDSDGDGLISAEEAMRDK